jgi:hypothetical protein
VVDHPEAHEDQEHVNGERGQSSNAAGIRRSGARGYRPVASAAVTAGIGSPVVKSTAAKGATHWV